MNPRSSFNGVKLWKFFIIFFFLKSKLSSYSVCMQFCSHKGACIALFKHKRRYFVVVFFQKQILYAPIIKRYYLRQFCIYKTGFGIKLLDVFDFHFCYSLSQNISSYCVSMQYCSHECEYMTLFKHKTNSPRADYLTICLTKILYI